MAEQPLPPATDTPPSAPPSEPTNPRLQSLCTRQSALLTTLSDLQSQLTTLVSTATLPSGLPLPANLSDRERTDLALSSAKEVIKEHIALLHKYNEIKDIGMGLMGLTAEKRGVQVKEVMEDLGVGAGD